MFVRPISRILEHSRTFLFMSLMSCYILYPTSPYNMHYTARDSGVFLYTGWRILNGQLPYRDIWDHKPPLIFYIDALGLLIANNSRWGVWFIEVISITFAIFISYTLVKSIFSRFVATIATTLWVISLPYMNNGGNLPTEYSLPLQFSCLYLFIIISKKEKTILMWFALGIITAFLFLLKQTTIGITFSIFLYMYLYQFRRGKYIAAIKATILAFSGYMAIAAILLVYFLINNALPEFYSSVFKYNFSYITEGQSTDYMASIYQGILRLIALTNIGLWQLTAVGLYVFLAKIIHVEYNVKRSILIISIINLVIEFVLISMSGRFYEHYFITIIPSMTVISSLGITFIINTLRKTSRTAILLRPLIIFVIFLVMYIHYGDYRQYIAAMSNIGNAEIIDYIQSNTNQNDFVLLWGAEPYINFFSKRQSPTKFVYQYPLYSVGYTDEQMIVTFLDSIISNRTSLIIDTNNETTPFLSFPLTSNDISRRLDFIRMHYKYTTKVANFTIYTSDLSQQPIP